MQSATRLSLNTTRYALGSGYAYARAHTHDNTNKTLDETPPRDTAYSSGSAISRRLAREGTGWSGGGAAGRARTLARALLSEGALLDQLALVDEEVLRSRQG